MVQVVKCQEPKALGMLTKDDLQTELKKAQVHLSVPIWMKLLKHIRIFGRSWMPKRI